MKTWYDERNTLFSRVKLEKDSKAYKAFYEKHPEYQRIDDEIRGSQFRDNLRKSDVFKSLFFPLTTSNTALLKSLHELVFNTERSKRVETPKNFHQNIKAITKHYGASDVGIVKLNDRHFYTHSGGLSESIGIKNYGEKIRPNYTHAIVYLIPMDLAYINRAPHFEELLETENAYLKVGFIGSRLALYLKSLGYDTTFQSEAYYLTPLVPLAYDGGLGEIGMTNHIVHPTYGDRIRLGAVLTTLELKEDEPIDFGLDAFCKRCALCLMNCPSKSITAKQRIVNGRTFYKFDDQTCFKLWKNTGTDCGTCIQSCPFTQGIDKQTIQMMQNDPSTIDEVIQKHLEIHGRRKYTKCELELVRLEET